MLPEGLSYIKFDASLYKRTVQYLTKHDPKMIYIYGGADPWVASGVTWLKENNRFAYVLPTVILLVLCLLIILLKRK